MVNMNNFIVLTSIHFPKIKAANNAFCSMKI